LAVPAILTNNALMFLPGRHLAATSNLPGTSFDTLIQGPIHFTPTTATPSNPPYCGLFIVLPNNTGCSVLSRNLSERASCGRLVTDATSSRTAASESGAPTAVATAARDWTLTVSIGTRPGWAGRRARRRPPGFHPGHPGRRAATNQRPVRRVMEYQSCP
jgi:hypothetical protein